MAVTVMKFGGTSVDKMEEVSDLVTAEKARGNMPVAVVSAFSGETNKLLAVGQQVLETLDGDWDPVEIVGFFGGITRDTVLRAVHFLENEYIDKGSIQKVGKLIDDYLHSQVCEAVTMIGIAQDQGLAGEQLRTYATDKIVGLGEVFSAKILAMMMMVRMRVQACRDINLKDVFQIYDASRLSTEKGVVDQEKLYQSISVNIAERVRACLENNEIPVVTGYVGYIPGGILNTIDRGYTDSTAAMTARGLKRISGGHEDVKLEIWKEVDGLLSADPRIVGKDRAKLRTKAHFDEAAELSDLAGMKAINPHGVWVLDGENIPIIVKNTFSPGGAGTTISLEDDEDVRGVRFISGKKGQSVYRVSSSRMIEQKGVAAKVFTACAELGVSVDAITTSARTVAFSVESKHARNQQLVELLSNIGTVDLCDDMAIVCCIGNNMADKKGLLCWLSGILAAHDINIEFDGGDGDRNVTFILREDDYEKAIKALHDAVFYPSLEQARKGAQKVMKPFLRRYLRVVGK